jgi:hypothetical protein
LFLLFVGFVLTGLLGSWLTFWFQRSADDRRREVERREARRGAAEKVFRDVASSVDRRLYLTRRYDLALSSRADSATLKAYRAQMDSAIADWNMTVNTNAVLVCMYFGGDLESFFTNGLARSLDVYSRQLKYRDLGITPAQLEDHYRRLANVAYALDMRLGNRIRTGTVVNDTTGDGCSGLSGLSTALPVFKESGPVTFDRL